MHTVTTQRGLKRVHNMGPEHNKMSEATRFIVEIKGIKVDVRVKRDGIYYLARKTVWVGPFWDRAEVIRSIKLAFMMDKLI